MATTKKIAAKKSAARKPARTVKKAGTSRESATSRKAAFVNAFIANGGNATEAAIAVGYSPTSARFQGSRMVNDPEIAQQIATRAQQIAKKYELTADLVVKSLVQELTFDPAQLYDEHGQLRAVADLPEDTRMALVAVEAEQHGSPDAPVYTRKVKWAAKHQAREQAMKHLGMFERDNQQRNPLDGVDHETLRAVVTHLTGARLQEAHGRR